jgi:cysteinyl-tRNA synthetase
MSGVRWMLLVVTMMAVPPAAAESWDIESFTYWLSGPQPALIAASGFDLAIVDYSADGTQAGAFDRAAVRRMQRKPDGGRRLVLAYLSIGEAETYRYYWRRSWAENPPPWLGEENPDWPGNYKVRFWHDGWQRILLGDERAYLDRILAAGFDGVYLDVVDAYWFFQVQGRKTAADEMIDLVMRIAAYARGARPGFLIVPQNAEDLLAQPRYRGVIDAIAKEDLWYGLAGPDTRNDPDTVAWTTKHLAMARDDGKAVLVVEYPETRKTVADVYARARRQGYTPYASVRALDRMVINRGLDPGMPGLEMRE